VKIKVKKGRGIDKQKSPGVDGAALKFTGLNPAEVDIQLHIYDNPDAFAAWCQMLAEIDPHRPGATQEPYEIINPEPNHMGVTKIVVEEIESESPTCKSGKDYRIKCTQWFPDVKTSKSKTTAQAKNPAPVPEILVPTSGLNGAPNWIEPNQTVNNWVEANPLTGLTQDVPNFGSNAKP
jgi:hypothetical protein